MSCGVQQSRGSHDAQLSGTHRTVGTYKGWWVEGLGDEEFAQTLFVWVGMPFFLPTDSLCKPEEAEQKSGSTLTAHHLILDFWSVPHI